MYNVDFKKLANWLLPVIMRQPKFLKWMRALIYPLENLKYRFSTNREINLYKLARNGQVFSLTKVLNEKFDSSGKRIWLTNGLTLDRIYVFISDESKAIKLVTATEPGPVIIHNPEDYADSGTDFIVWVPNSVSLPNQEEIKMKAEIDFYKLPAKRYRIYRT